MVNCQLHDPVAATSRKVPSTIWIECWLVSRANVDAVKMTKISTAVICTEPLLQTQCCQHNFYCHHISFPTTGMGAKLLIMTSRVGKQFLAQLNSKDRGTNFTEMVLTG